MTLYTTSEYDTKINKKEYKDGWNKSTPVYQFIRSNNDLIYKFNEVEGLIYFASSDTSVGEIGITMENGISGEIHCNYLEVNHLQHYKTGLGGSPDFLKNEIHDPYVDLLSEVGSWEIPLTGLDFPRWNRFWWEKRTPIGRRV